MAQGCRLLSGKVERRKVAINGASSLSLPPTAKGNSFGILNRKQGGVEEEGKRGEWCRFSVPLSGKSAARILKSHANMCECVRARENHCRLTWLFFG